MLYLLVLSLLTLVLAYVYLLFRNPYAGLISLLVVEFIDYAFGLNSQLVGGIHLDPLDAVSICLLLAGCLRSMQRVRGITLMSMFSAGYLLLFAVSLGRGIAANGFMTAANESRGFIGPLTALLYFATAPTDSESLRKYTRAYLYFGGALCAAATLAAVGLPIGLNALGGAEALGLDGRYLPAGAAAAIATCGFLLLALLRHKATGLVRALVPIVFLCIAVYLRHRTVWIMLCVGALALLPLDRKLFLRLLPAAGVAVVLVIGLAIYGNSMRGFVSEDQFAASATNFGTFSWRLNGWNNLLFDDEQTPLTVAFGKSMGEGYWRIDPVSEQVTGVAPHSEYVQEYLRVGAVGAFVIVCFGIRPLFRMWKLARYAPLAMYPTTSVWTVITLITLVYGVSYGIQPHSYALIALANAFLTRAGARNMGVFGAVESAQWNASVVRSAA